MNQQDRLSEALRDRARLGTPPGADHPLTLADVQRRARGIRRRRAAVSGLAVAAAFAIAVPIGVSVTDRTSGGVDDPPVASRTGDAAPNGGEVLLTTQADASSSAPGIPYLRDGGVVTPDGGELPLAGDYGAFAPLGDGWVALDIGAGRVDVLDANGQVTSSEPGTWPLAVAAGSGVVAFGSSSGDVSTAAAGQAPRLLASVSTGPVRVAGVLSVGSCAPDEKDGCTVYYSPDGQELGGGWLVGPQVPPQRLPVVRSVESLAPDGRIAGFTSVEDDGSCSAVVNTDGSTAWKTCDHSLGRFSPDGHYVVGHPAYRDGIGDGTVAILDAATGEVLVEYRNSMETQAFINNVAWDTDDTLLATVYERGSWSLMRMTVGGELSVVLGDIGKDEMQVPVVLPTQP